MVWAVIGQHAQLYMALQIHEFAICCMMLM
jgi:hypothetical protein